MSPELTTPHVLAIDCRPRGKAPAIRVTHVSSSREALLALRASTFDVVVTALAVDGAPIWPLMDKLRRLRPKLPWWLVAADLSPPDEVVARTLGVKRILERPPWAKDICLAFGLPAVRFMPPPESIDLEPVSNRS